MPPETIRVDVRQGEDRYSRFRLIPWWEQEKISAARVLVIGAGALGNEILKNMALLGFQHVLVVDMDRIELTNLSRAILFRGKDVGQSKADTVAAAYRELLPDATVQPLTANVVRECGLGLFTWADLVIAGLDNREARLWINRASWKTKRPWVDGAIEGINGVARVFLPGKAPCYECTLGEVDWAILQRRMSCNLLLHEAHTEGRVPTTPTISSIIAGIQVQEAVKLLHGMPTLAGKGYIFEGLQHTSYVVDYTENPQCLSHYIMDHVVELAQPSRALTLDQLWQCAAADLNTDEVVIDFSRDIIYKLVCPTCSAEQEYFVPVGALSYNQGKCVRDGSMRIVQTISGYRREPELAQRTLDQLGLPLFDIFTARSNEAEISYCMAGDAEQVLGPLSQVRR
jgi:molybdopterin/thiamine biosynthesis adenylyltransferase